MARSSKTEQVMGLLGKKPSREKQNPAVCAPQPQKAQPPAVASMTASKAAEKKPNVKYQWNRSGKQIVNIVTMLINEELGAVLERFNACDCDKCCKFVTEVVAGALPSIFVRVKSISGQDAVNDALDKYRPAVIKALTKAVLAAKKAPPHE